MKDQVSFKVVSDLHLEGNSVPDLTNREGADVLILAGDICTHKSVQNLHNLLVRYAGQYDIVIWVLGNHELYRWETPNDKSYIEYFRKQVSAYSNVYVLENETINYKGLRIAGATMWTDFDDGYLVTSAHRYLNDYRWGLKADIVYDWFRETYQFLEKSNADVVITHHAPLHLSVDDQYTGSYINPLFHSNLETLITNLRPHLWVHGHMHNSSDYVFQATRVVCNPFGYGKENLNGFDPGKVVSVPTLC